MKVCLLIVMGIGVCATAMADRLPTGIRGVYGGFPSELLREGEKVSDYGINAVFVGSGLINEDMVRQAREHGVRLYAEFNTMHVAGYLKEHPDAAPIGTDGSRCPPAEGWQGICPTHERYRRYRMGRFRELLTDHAIDGVWLDYHHSHASWERAEPVLPDTCFCGRCLREFSQATGVRLPEEPTAEVSKLLLGEHRQQWVQWRCDVFTDWVREFRQIIDEVRPAALLGTYHCPWNATDRGGALREKLAIDLKAQAKYVDVFSPMPYHARFGHADDPHWVARQVAWLGGYLGIEGKPEERHRIWPIVQLSDWGEAVALDQVATVLDYGSRRPATGVMVFRWSSPRDEKELGKGRAMAAFYLVQQAGNAEDDAERLAYLKRLQSRTGLDAALKQDVDRLVKEVDRWVHTTSLAYFGREVGKTLDYVGMKFDERSPLYPIGCLYRARMLTWLTMESGGIWNNPERRKQFLGKARELFETAAKAYPENRVIRMYLGDTIPPHKEYPAVEGAPEWAIYQREGLERLADIVEWWIDNRLQEGGAYGGGWGDDCEMWRWWVPVLIAFDDPKISKAQADFSDALMSQEHMAKGFTTRMSDVEHTAEDSSDVITPMMHLDPDNELWKQRALRMAELMESLWTGTNERGQLQYKSTYFTVDKVDDNPQRACDTVYHPRAVQPALLYWQRTGDERLGKLFSAWMDTWVDATARAERGKPAGIIPTAIHWPDGGIGGVGENWWDPRNHGEATLYQWPSAMSMMLDTLLLTYHMTGDEKYLKPIRSMAAARLRYLKSPTNDPRPGTEAWCASKRGFLNGTVAKYRFLTGSTEFDELLSRDASAYVAFRLRGDRRALTDALRNNAEALRVNWPGYTSEVRYTDRVLRFPSILRKGYMLEEDLASARRPNTGSLSSTAIGEPGDALYFPMNAVRWLTPPRDIAALVVDSGADRFEAELFHFGAEPRAMGAELYLLATGQYRLTLSASGAPETTQQVRVTGPRTRVTFRLPAQRLCRLLVRPAQ